jgi:pimeloyl-ACP methyl ester carboxylesterase
MLAFEREGTGPPLVLLHGTNSARSIWKPLVAELRGERELISVDLPAHGESPASSFAPPDWAREVAELLDALGLERAALVGHSSGGWTALELAKLGRATAVLALTPAGLWRRHSPLVTDALLAVNWRLGQVLGERVVLAPLGSRAGRRVALRQIAARPAEVPQDLAREMVATVLASKSFPEHFRQTRRLRFTGGQEIAPVVPVRVVWGDRDRIARRRASRHRDELPAHAVVETWPRCGHMVMWDAAERLRAAMLALPVAAAVAF